MAATSAKYLPKLDDGNYLVWRRRMQEIFQTRGLWEAVKGYRDAANVELTADALSTAQKTKNREAAALIMTCVDDIFVRDIQEEELAVERWRILETLHFDLASLDIATIFGELYSYTKSESMTMREYISKQEDILEKIQAVGVKIPDEIKAGMILPGLPKKKYGDLMKQFRVEDKTLTFLNVKARLLKFSRQEDLEKLKKREEDVGVAHAVVARPSTSKSKDQGGPNNSIIRCFKCGENGHGLKECKNDYKCYVCSGKGHISKNCPSNKQGGKGAAKVVMASDEKAVCMNVSGVMKKTGTYLDSCASHHMSPIRERFVNLVNEVSVSSVMQGDDSELKVMGMGDLVVKMASGYTVTFKDVLYIPDLGTTLISVARMTEKGFKVVFAHDEGVVMNKNNEEIYRVLNENYVYRIITDDHVRGECKILAGKLNVGLAYKNTVSASLWHGRFGHCNVDALKRIKNI